MTPTCSWEPLTERYECGGAICRCGPPLVHDDAWRRVVERQRRDRAKALERFNGSRIHRAIVVVLPRVVLWGAIGLALWLGLR